MIRKLLIVLAATALITGLQTASAHAASQSIALTPQGTIADNPHVGGDSNSPTYSDMDAVQKMPLSSTQTAVDTDETALYTWRLTVSSLCEGAVITGLRVVTDTVMTEEHPETGVYLAVYGDSNLTAFDNYMINGGLGEDTGAWLSSLVGVPFLAVDRGVSGGSWYPADLGTAGRLDATWALTGYVVGQPLGIALLHDFEASGQTSGQTTIQSVTLTYDDAGCAAVSDTDGEDAGTTVTSQPQAQLADTGTNAAGMAIAATTLLTTTGALLHRKGFSVSLH